MNAASGGDLDARVLSQPEARRRCAVGGAKRARERLMRLVPSVEGDLGNRPLPVFQFPCRALEAQPARQLERGLADHAAEHSMKVKRRQAGDTRQRLQLERIVQEIGRAHV